MNVASPLEEIRWQVVGASSVGARHARSGRPNQDAFGWFPESGCGSPIVCAVADGHGSAEYARSGIGARIAVSIAIEELVAIAVGKDRDSVSLSELKRFCVDLLPGVLVRRFESEVHRHIAECAVGAEELSEIEAAVGLARRQMVEAHLPRMYGTTLLAAMITKNFALYLQLGDGDLLAVSDDGDVIQPIPGDPRLFANETTSIISPTASVDMRVTFQAISGAPPALVMLTTDGYANCFTTPESFLKVGPDILAMVRVHGWNAVNEDAPDWMHDASVIGGDDSTLVVAIRQDLSPERTESFESQGGTSHQLSEGPSRPKREM